MRTLTFWIVSFTWGIIMTLIGFIFLGVNVLTNKIETVIIVQGRIVVRLKYNIGGVSLGPIAYIGLYQGDDTMWHEMGHTVQHVFWGPLFLLVIGIPSLIRASLWDRLKETDYDAIWFEGQATIIGEKMRQKHYSRSRLK